MLMSCDEGLAVLCIVMGCGWPEGLSGVAESSCWLSECSVSRGLRGCLRDGRTVRYRRVSLKVVVFCVL